MARHRVLHDLVSHLRLGAIVAQQVPEIDMSVEQDLTRATLMMKGDLTIVEPIGTVTSVLVVFLQRNNWLLSNPQSRWLRQISQGPLYC